MYFYFVHENNMMTRIDGHTNKECEQAVFKAMDKEPRGSGVLGVVDSNNKVRATVSIYKNRGKYITAVEEFIRKYRAIGALENLDKFKLKDKK
jgi:hypothetical protein